jgi:Uma2 family endonuclease
MGLPAPHLFTPEEYLAFENPSPEKHEYFDGHIIARAGASPAHNEIQTNLIRLLANKFIENKRPCKPYASDTRAQVSETKYFYPDVSVYCRAPDVDSLNNWKNPEVVIEIISDSTASFDQNEKAAAYRQMPSLKELVLIDSRVKAITIFQKQDDGAWVERSYGDQTVAVKIAGEELALVEIYEGVFQ